MLIEIARTRIDPASIVGWRQRPVIVVLSPELDVHV